MFPGGGPGFALLLLRVSVAAIFLISVAKRFGVGGSDTNAAYVKLPDFLLIEGTVGNPTPDKRKLLVLGTSAVGGIVNAFQGGGTVGNLIQGAGNLLGGRSSQPAGSNAPDRHGCGAAGGRLRTLATWGSLPLPPL